MLELEGDLLTFNDTQFKVIHHLNQGTTQHSLIAATDEHADYITEVLREGGDISVFYTIKELKGFEEYQPYFRCHGLYKKHALVGVWDLPVCSKETLLTREDFEQSEFVDLCVDALREAKILTLRMQSNQLNEKKADTFFDQIGIDDEGSFMILDQPLEGEYAEVLEDIGDIHIPEQKTHKLKKAALKHKVATNPQEWQPEGGDGILEIQTQETLDLDL